MPVHLPFKFLIGDRVQVLSGFGWVAGNPDPVEWKGLATVDKHVGGHYRVVEDVNGDVGMWVDYWKADEQLCLVRRKQT